MADPGAGITILLKCFGCTRNSVKSRPVTYRINFRLKLPYLVYGGIKK
jgi:hypothetical protein